MLRTVRFMKRLIEQNPPGSGDYSVTDEQISCCYHTDQEALGFVFDMLNNEIHQLKIITCLKDNSQHCICVDFQEDKICVVMSKSESRLGDRRLWSCWDQCLANNPQLYCAFLVLYADSIISVQGHEDEYGRNLVKTLRVVCHKGAFPRPCDENIGKDAVFAVLCAEHPRLGNDSPLRVLPKHWLESIVGMAAVGVGTMPELYCLVITNRLAPERCTAVVTELLAKRGLLTAETESAFAEEKGDPKYTVAV